MSPNVILSEAKNLYRNAQLSANLPQRWLARLIFRCAQDGNRR
jgi:hypothetical protein